MNEMAPIISQEKIRKQRLRRILEGVKPDYWKSEKFNITDETAALFDDTLKVFLAINTHLKTTKKYPETWSEIGYDQPPQILIAKEDDTEVARIKTEAPEENYDVPLLFKTYPFPKDAVHGAFDFLSGAVDENTEAMKHVLGRLQDFEQKFDSVLNATEHDISDAVATRTKKLAARIADHLAEYNSLPDAAALNRICINLEMSAAPYIYAGFGTSENTKDSVIDFQTFTLPSAEQLLAHWRITD